MKLFTTLLIFILLSSCIPLRIAPKIAGDKIKKARKFKRGLPNQYAFIFEDPKEADEFYYFINAKYDLNHNLVDSNVPFIVSGVTYALSFYEVERTTKTLNLLPILIDAAIQDDDDDEPLFEDAYTSRSGRWYLILIVNDTNMNDCLSPNYVKREEVIAYLRKLQNEYLITHDYKVAKLRHQLSKPLVD